MGERRDRFSVSVYLLLAFDSLLEGWLVPVDWWPRPWLIERIAVLMAEQVQTRLRRQSEDAS